MSDRQHRREQRSHRHDELALLEKLMSEPAGRRWVYNFLASCRIYATSFATNALAMAFNEGDRNAGLRLLVDITEASPDLYLLMLKEVQNERNTNRGPKHDGDPEPDDDGTG